LGERLDHCLSLQHLDFTQDINDQVVSKVEWIDDRNQLNEPLVYQPGDPVPHRPFSYAKLPGDLGAGHARILVKQDD
jgi:hypothetical protein